MAEETLRAVVTADISQFQAAMSQMASLVQHASQNLQQQTRQFTQGVQQITQATTQLGQATQQVAQHGAGLTQTFAVMKGALGALGIQATISGLVQLGKEAVTVAARMESLTASLKVVSGGLAGAQATMGFLRLESQRLGVNFLTMAESFRGIEAAARGTSLQGEQARKIFLSIAEAGRVMGLSGNQVQHVLIAVEQMMNKGKISAEELRRQMANFLPGSFEIAARAMGVTTQELDKMLKQGELFSEEFLPKFARQLRKELGGGVEDATKTAVAAWERLKSAMIGLADSIGSAVLPALVKIADAISDITNRITGVLDKAKDAQAAQKLMGQAGVKDPSQISPKGVEQATQVASRLAGLDRLILEEVERSRQLRMQLEKQPGSRFIQSQIDVIDRRIAEYQERRVRAEGSLKPQLDLERFMKALSGGMGAGAKPMTFFERPEKVDEYQREIKELDKTFKDLFRTLENVNAQAKNTPGLFAADKAQKRIPLPTNVADLIEQLAPGYGLDPRVIQAMVLQESGGRANALSPAGAKGLMQLMPATAAEYNVQNAYDPEENLRAGMQYMQKMMAMWAGRPADEQLRLALASYNAGPGAVQKYGGVPPYPETQGYVKSVTGMVGKGLGGGVDDLKLVEAQIRAIEKGLGEINDLLAKTPALQEKIPEALQKELDTANEILTSLQTKKTLLEKEAEVQRLSSADAVKHATEIAQLEEEIRTESLAATKRLGEERKRLMEEEVEDARHAAITIANLRRDLDADTDKERLKEREKTIDDLLKIEQRAGREMEEEQKRQQREMAQFAEGIQRQLSQTFFQIFKGNKDIFQGILDLFLKLLADMAAAATTKQIIIPVLAKLFGSGGDGAGFLSGLTGEGAAGSSYIQAAATLSGSLSGGEGSGLYQRALSGLLNTQLVSWGGAQGGTTAQGVAALGGGTTGTQSFYGTRAAGSAAAKPGGGAAGGVTVGSAIQGIGTGIAVGMITNQGLTALGLSGKSRSAGQVANTTISGLVGGAAAGAQFGPYGAIIGAVVGAIGGLIAGITAGMRDRQKFDITKTQPRSYDYDEITGIRQLSDFNVLAAKTARLDTYTRNFGMTKVAEAAGDLFDNLTQQIKQVDPALQKAAIGPLNAYAEVISDLITGTKFEGKKQIDQIKNFIAGELPQAFNQTVEPLIEGLNVLGPIAAQFRDVINTLKGALEALDSQERELKASLASQSKGMSEATFSTRDLFARRLDELNQLQLDMAAAATPSARLTFIPQVQQIVNQIFDLGTQALQDIQGQFVQVIDALQAQGDALGQQRLQARAALDAQSQGLQESTWTPAQLFMRRRAELAHIQSLIPSASAQERITLVPQAQQLVDQIFQLGAQESVLGQEPEAVRALQAELGETLRQLTGVSDAAFAWEQTITQQQLTLAQQQLEALRTSTANSVGLLTIMDQARAALVQIQGTGSTSSDIAGVGALQNEMISVLRDLTGVSDSAFASLRSDTQSQLALAQQQVEYLAANLTNTANLNLIAGQTLTVLGDIRSFLTTGVITQSTYNLPSPAPTPAPAPAPEAPAAAPAPRPTVGPYGAVAPPGGTLDDVGIIHYGDGSTYNTWTGGNTNPNGWSSDNYQSGTAYVPRTGLALLHQGEAVIPAALNRAAPLQGMGGGQGMTMTVHAPITINASGVTAHPEELAQTISEHLQRVIELRSRLGQSSLRTRGVA